MPGAGIIRNAGIIRGRVLFDEIRYLKLQILASYNNLRIGQDSEFGKF